LVICTSGAPCPLAAYANGDRHRLLKAKVHRRCQKGKIIIFRPKSLEFELLLGFNELWTGLYDDDKTMLNFGCSKEHIEHIVKSMEKCPTRKNYMREKDPFMNNGLGTKFMVIFILLNPRHDFQNGWLSHT